MELSTLLLERFLPEALQPLSGGCWWSRGWLDACCLAGFRQQPAAVAGGCTARLLRCILTP
jgi:hypothetical protein